MKIGEKVKTMITNSLIKLNFYRNFLKIVNQQIFTIKDWGKLRFDFLSFDNTHRNVGFFVL